MRLYILVDPRATSSRVLSEVGVELHRAIVVLKHDDGPLGFNRNDGTKVMAAIVGNTVVIEQTNGAAWRTMTAASVESHGVNGQFRQVVTCSGATASLSRELDTLEDNRVRQMKSALLERHGKPPLPLTPTMFDDWVTEGRVRAGALMRLASMCETVALWPFSDWGIYGELFGVSRDQALASVVAAGNALGITVEEVGGESMLPMW